MKTNACFDKENLVNYVIYQHDKIKKSYISPLKLQKTMYLLYAMWGGNALLINNDIDKGEKITELDKKVPVDLFDSNFEAWKYGPVDPDIYFKFKNNKYKGNVCSLRDNCNADYSILDSIIAFIDSILRQAFDINDFSLVTITHDDEVWDKAYKNTLCNKMNGDDISREYYNRFLKKRNA